MFVEKQYLYFVKSNFIKFARANATNKHNNKIFYSVSKHYRLNGWYYFDTFLFFLIRVSVLLSFRTQILYSWGSTMFRMVRQPSCEAMARALPPCALATPVTSAGALYSATALPSMVLKKEMESTESSKRHESTFKIWMSIW